MEDIFSLIKCLTNAEWQSLQQYLTCFTVQDASQLKFIQLAKMLREADTCPKEECCRMKTNYSKDTLAFDKLKSRLKEKTLDFLLTDISCDKKQELDEMDYAIVKMNKKAAQFQQLYYSKKRIPIIYDLIDEIIFLAKEYERYAVLVEYLIHKKNLVSFKNGKEEFQKINKKIEHATKSMALYNKAEHYYFELILRLDYSGKQDTEKKLLFLQKAIAEIKTENADIKSPHVSYSLKFLELEYYQIKNDYSKAHSVCTEWLDIVRDNKSVYRKQRIGVVYDNLSRCKYYLGDFKQAVEFAQLAQKHFNLNSENYCIALEQEFYALFASAQYAAAKDTAEKMLASATKKELGEFRWAKYNVLLANALFKQNNFNEALNILSQPLEISKDKTGWETGARVLKIMTLIEMLKLDEASLETLSLKQFFKRTEEKTQISPRDKTILKLLLHAERKGFMFTILNGKTEQPLADLNSDNENMRWQPFTHEVIPFHKWFSGKMNHKRKIPVHSLI